MFLVCFVGFLPHLLKLGQQVGSFQTVLRKQHVDFRLFLDK